MKPFVETVVPEEGASWAFLDRQLDDGIPFEWHHHPEFELTLTLNSFGYRYIGDDVSAYDDGDLVLVAPGVPHSWHSRQSINDAQPHAALVCWFTRSWIEQVIRFFPELGSLRRLIDNAEGCLTFSVTARAEVRPLLVAMRAASPAERLMFLLKTLSRLSRDADISCLQGSGLSTPPSLMSDLRMARILDFLHASYVDHVTVEEVALVACMSVSATQRMFRRHARMSIVDYLVKLRIGRACAMLMQDRKPISVVATEVGYSNLALFNRQFLRQKGLSPRDFRRQHGLVLQTA